MPCHSLKPLKKVLSEKAIKYCWCHRPSDQTTERKPVLYRSRCPFLEQGENVTSVPILEVCSFPSCGKSDCEVE